jgi:tetratricopeptide (TPR) repeat protein
VRLIIGYGPELFRSAYMLVSQPNPAQGLLPNEESHAHNYFIHQGVELGFLGLVTSAGVFLSIFAAGAYQLVRQRRTDPALHAMLIVGLLATFAGRMLEQQFGVARVSDLTLFWVLAAAFVALPAVLRPASEAAGPDSSLSRQLGPTGESLGLRPWWKPSTRHLVWRVGLIACVAAGIGVLTWVKSVNLPRAAFFADQGAEQFRHGQLQAALLSLDRAIEQAPDVSTYYERWSAVAWASRPDALDPGPADCPTKAGENARWECLAEEAYSRKKDWVLLRPFYFRSRLALADSALELGVGNGDAGMLDESIRLYTDAANMVPNSWPLWNLLAEAYIRAGRHEEALPALARSAAITKDSPLSDYALVLEGRVHLASERPGKALEAFTQAVRVNPRNTEARYARGSTLHQLGRLGQAIEDFNAVIGINPQFGLAYNNRGLAYAQIGQRERAIQDFDQAIRLEPKFAPAFNNRGLTYRELGQPERAIDDLSRAILLDPQLQVAYYNRALAYTLLGNDSLAQQDAAAAVGLGFDRASLELAMSELKRRR